MKLLKRPHSERERAYHYKSLFLSLFIGGIISLITALSGHETAQMLHAHQPEKLAAAEGLFETQAYAPLSIGGVVDKETRSIKGAIEIPWALSFLAGNRFDTIVKGLNDFPEEEWPPLFVHTLFNLMVGIGMLLILVSVFTVGFRILAKRPYPRWLLYSLLFALARYPWWASRPAGCSAARDGSRGPFTISRRRRPPRRRPSIWARCLSYFSGCMRFC